MDVSIQERKPLLKKHIYILVKSVAGKDVEYNKNVLRGDAGHGKYTLNWKITQC